ncbi:hypothetical protein EYF80_050161 [Liparis tanakae]|uniref:Uncharacterized protein n=1 Tax=Liparis tanakae TaxID=230148 RepID=A0A4Z2FET1_9TELE|nr:hypothetical protein EYF80_050161 [Liparis tanakae]
MGDERSGEFTHKPHSGGNESRNVFQKKAKKRKVNNPGSKTLLQMWRKRGAFLTFVLQDKGNT